MVLFSESRGALVPVPSVAMEAAAVFRSRSYWEQRYRSGGNSGAGSYLRLAEFKAEVLNDFVRANDIRSVLEFGCGDGAQLSLARYPSYIGCDVSLTAVELCRRTFCADPTKSFLVVEDLPSTVASDLTLSLDVVFHLVEDHVFDSYMRQLFDHADRFVIVYSSNEDRRTADAHVRHRRFTDWVDSNRSAWRLASITPNAYPFDPADPEGTSFADFYVYSRRTT